MPRCLRCKGPTRITIRRNNESGNDRYAVCDCFKFDADGHPTGGGPLLLASDFIAMNDQATRTYTEEMHRKSERTDLELFTQ